MSVAGFDLYSAALGPLFIAAWLVFALGFAWRAWRFARMTTAVPRRELMPAPSSALTEADRKLLVAGSGGAGLAFRLRRRLRTGFFGAAPAMAVVSVAFHALLVVLPFLLPAHNILLYQSFRIGLPVLPEPVMDLLTLAILAIGAFLVLRRLFLARVRSLTTAGDYLVLLLVAAPFISSYLAYHQLLEYRSVLVAHMLLGELLIAAIPFTKLGHMPFLLLSRLFVAGEYSRPGAARRW